MGNPFDIVEHDELIKLRNKFEKLIVQRRREGEPELGPINMGTHVVVQFISVRGPIDSVLALHELRGPLRAIGSCKEIEGEKDYATIWYELDDRPESIPDDLGLISESEIV